MPYRTGREAWYLSVSTEQNQIKKPPTPTSPEKKEKIGGHTDGDVLRRPLLRGAWSISENA